MVWGFSKIEEALINVAFKFHRYYRKFAFNMKLSYIKHSNFMFFSY
jgi:hypothetical protein